MCTKKQTHRHGAHLYKTVTLRKAKRLLSTQSFLLSSAKMVFHRTNYHLEKIETAQVPKATSKCSNFFLQKCELVWFKFGFNFFLSLFLIIKRCVQHAFYLYFIPDEKQTVKKTQSRTYLSFSELGEIMWSLNFGLRHSHAIRYQISFQSVFAVVFFFLQEIHKKLRQTEPFRNQQTLLFLFS